MLREAYHISLKSCLFVQVSQQFAIVTFAASSENNVAGSISLNKLDDS